MGVVLSPGKADSPPDACRPSSAQRSIYRENCACAAIGAHCIFITKFQSGAPHRLPARLCEHSYPVDFVAKAATCDTFMDAIRWTNTEHLFRAASNNSGAEA